MNDQEKINATVVYLLAYLIDQTGQRMSFKIDPGTLAQAYIVAARGLWMTCEKGVDGELIVRFNE